MPRQVTGLQLFGLFGYLDHTMSFPLERNFTIVYGANGVGKTTVLKLLDSVLSQRLVDLTTIPFSRMLLTLDDGSTLEIDSLSSDDEEDAGSELLCAFSDRTSGGRIEQLVRRRSHIRPAMRRWLISETSWRPVERGLWQDLSDGELRSEAELADLFDNRRGAPRALVEDARKEDEDGSRIAEALDVTPPFSILTERLGSQQVGSRVGRVRMTETVARYSEEIRTVVSQAFTKDAVLSQELDRTFPSRLLADEIRETPSEDAIRSLYDAQVQRRAQLRRIGLLSGMSDIELPSGEIADWKLRTLALFLDDANKRLDQFDEFVPQFSLFHEMVNNRLVGKELVISDAGIKVRLAATGRELPPTRLSSGEQHELILTYGLIFHSEPGQLVLIDEPEISLHAAWQRQFLPDLQRIFGLTGARAVIATHSPMIVDRWSDSMVELSA